MNRAISKYLVLTLLVAGNLLASAGVFLWKLGEVDDGYAATSVNTAVFRGSSLATHGFRLF